MIKSLFNELNCNGFVVIDNYLSMTQVAKVERQLKDAFLSEKVIHVNNDDIVIATINGNRPLHDRIKITASLYELRVSRKKKVS